MKRKAAHMQTERARKTQKVPEAEKEQVRARMAIGHDFALTTDEHGRMRMAYGTVGSKRLYDLTSAGYVRLRQVDPLKGIMSLSDGHRAAGTKYRETAELCIIAGASGGQFQERVDGGGMPKGTAEVVAVALDAIERARSAIGHHEIVGIVDAVCISGQSIKQISERTRDPRDALVRLLKIGLDNLTYHYGIVPRPKQKA